jgi:hypothetical protein
MNKVNKSGHMHHFDVEAGASPFWKKDVATFLEALFLEIRLTVGKRANDTRLGSIW